MIKSPEKVKTVNNPVYSVRRRSRRTF